MAGMHLIVRPNLNSCQSLDADRLLAKDNASSRRSHKDRDILGRFYLDEQTPEKICQDMSLTDNQFRNIKSRAKTKLAEIFLQKEEIGLPLLQLDTSPAS